MKLLLSITLLFFTLFSIAQSQFKEPISNYKQVRVANWEKVSILVSDVFWENNREKIISLIGKNEFDTVKKYASMAEWPKPFRYKTTYVRDTILRNEWKKRLSKLKAYPIASFNHFFEGKDWGEYVILKFPYLENRGIDSLAKWNFMYLLTRKEAIAVAQ